MKKQHASACRPRHRPVTLKRKMKSSASPRPDALTPLAYHEDHNEEPKRDSRDTDARELWHKTERFSVQILPNLLEVTSLRHVRETSNDRKYTSARS
jgi:hypothetical protein